MVPLSLGSQTGGSTIRPGSYCGVYALKPTHGSVSRHGMFQLSRSLDHVGLFARTVEDLALLLEEVAGYDERDPDTHPRGRGPYRTVAMEAPPIEPRFGFFRSGRWSRVAEDAQAALGELVEHLGGRVEEFELSAGADELAEWHRVIMDAELAVNLGREWETGRDRLSAPLRARIEHGHAVRAPEYLAAKAAAGPLMATFTELFEQRYDAILTPAVDGTAPAGLESTGEPTFCTLWTMLGLPAVSLPLLQGANGLPLGVQLVGPRHGDGRLLRTARCWRSRWGCRGPPLTLPSPLRGRGSRCHTFLPEERVSKSRPLPPWGEGRGERRRYTRGHYRPRHHRDSTARPPPSS